MNPYRLSPDRFNVINFSGGRSSAYMLMNILVEYDYVLPDNAEVIFCNTGKERDETFKFVQECHERWAVPITWLEYCYRADQPGGRLHPKNHYKIVDITTAARHGEPFVELIESSNLLPNAVTRRCTSELKVDTVRRYILREKNIYRKGYVSILGIRADETRRVNKALMEECRVAYPMVYAGDTINDVMRFWKRMNFDLGIDSAYGNCDLCFLKGRKNIIQSIRDNPDRAQWWIDQEQKVWKHHAYATHASFIKTETYEELRAYALSQQTIDFPDDPELSCFCGD